MLLSQLSFAQVQEPVEDEMFIAEWDLAFPSKEAYENYQLRTTRKGKDLIIGTTALKALEVWDGVNRRNLSYCVSNTFGVHKNDVIEALKIATQDWMDVAGVRFFYKPSEDVNCTPSNQNVMFDVRPVSFGQYLARSFFPSYPRNNRNILIDASSFKHSFVSFSGFLRHELGHTLGFRHEHISKNGNQQCLEDGNFMPLTVYDQFSVMHYPQCGGKNNIENMILSPLDKTGASKVYPFLSL